MLLKDECLKGSSVYNRFLEANFFYMHLASNIDPKVCFEAKLLVKGVIFGAYSDS